MRPYVDALSREFDFYSDVLTPKTIYIGGGTPTVLPVDLLGNLFGILDEKVDLSNLVEFTIEANPGTLNDEKMRLLIESGVNRLSLGGQSFQIGLLETLGRIHTPEETIESVELAKRSGLNNISLDLIFAIPGQNPLKWQEDLETSLSLEPEHLSTYALTYEEGTPLEQALSEGRLTPASEEDEAEMYRLAIHHLTSRGFEHYEISNFASPSRRSLHNLTYWRNEPYVGIGACATSYVDFERRRNIRDIRGYLEAIRNERLPVEWKERLEPEKRARETAIMMLRLREGIEERDFYESTGFHLEELFEAEIEKFSKDRFLEYVGGRLRLSERGLFVADEILSELV